jgi:hypothetical protein
MFNAEVWFAFVLVPLYFLACARLALIPRFRSFTWRSLFALNWLLAAICFGIYSATTQFGFGNWIGVAVFSGSLAAIIGTALALKARARVRG